MPTTNAGREMVVKYLRDKKIPKNRLATLYGLSRSYVTQVLSGKLKGKASNEFILTVINDFNIEGDD